MGRHMQKVFLVEIFVEREGQPARQLMELVFLNEVPYVVFDWLDERANEAKTLVKLDQTQLQVGGDRSDYQYSSVVRDPRISTH